MSDVNVTVLKRTVRIMELIGAGCRISPRAARSIELCKTVKRGVSVVGFVDA